MIERRTGVMKLFLGLLAASFLAAPAAAQSTQPSLRYVGGDVSMLAELERFGATYSDANGKPADAIAVLRGAGWNVFRVRVFVGPSTDYDKTWGATQSLDVVRTLSKRIVADGGEVMLTIHYSDAWADPEHQAKPKAWAGLDADALEKRVHDYTADVIGKLVADGAPPALVQVGNEITAGVLWPDGEINEGTPAERAAKWKTFERLVVAGCRAVRESSPKSRIVIHAHGGGKLDLAFFYERFRDVDYDLIGLSFYPAFGETIDKLARQIPALKKTFGKDVIVAETSYPSRPMDLDAKWRKFMTWPLTPEGQATFARELNATVRDAGGVGIVWWFPEATPVKGHAVWREGAEGVFDANGRLLPTARTLAR